MARGGKREGAGRPKGAKDKISRDLKTRVLQIADELEAQGKGLRNEAEKDPQWFFTNFYKPMLPKNVELTGEDGGPMDIKWTVEIVEVKKK